MQLAAGAGVWCRCAGKACGFASCQIRALCDVLAQARETGHIRRGLTGCGPAQELMAEAEAELARVDERMGQDAPAAGPTVRLTRTTGSAPGCLRTLTHLTLRTRMPRLGDPPAASPCPPQAVACTPLTPKLSAHVCPAHASALSASSQVQCGSSQFNEAAATSFAHA